MSALDSNTLKSLVEINAKINSSNSDINALLFYIVESAMRLINCENAVLLLADKERKTLRFMVALGSKASSAVNLVIEKQSIAGWIIENNVPVIVGNVEADVRFSEEFRDKTGYIPVNMIAVPLRVKGTCIGVIELFDKTSGEKFSNDDLDILKMFSNQAGIAYQNSYEYQKKQESLAIVNKNLSSGSEYHTFIAKSPAILDLIHVIEEVAVTNSSVLITGESGVGKELFAEQLHLKSPRRNKPFIRVNCAALSPALLESELFGHVKGAYTNAVSDEEGRFLAADGGTLFLDEIGEFPLDLQVKLLRVIQTRKFEQVGSSRTISVDVRIVAATNRDLESMVKSGKFRADLYYRLNVLPINIPALRERKEDIEPLVLFFLKKFAADTKKSFIGFSPLAMKALYNYYWPGNIRELENTIERACVLGGPPYVQVSDLRLPESVFDENVSIASDREQKSAEELFAEECSVLSDEDKTLKSALNRFKKAYVCKILDQTSWNQTKAGKILGIQRTYVARLLNELHIREERNNK